MICHIIHGLSLHAKNSVSKSRWWIFLMNPQVCLEERGRGGCVRGSDSLKATGSWLFLADSLDCMDPEWYCQVPETTTTSSLTSGLNKVISVQHVSKYNEKKNVWTDGGVHLFHFPLVNLRSYFAHDMFVFHTFTCFSSDTV